MTSTARIVRGDPTETRQRLIGEHATMHQLRAELRRASGLAAPVLLEGPTGAGKEVAVELLHASSERPGRLVAINMAALSEQLIESELFGTVRGAFTGALQDRGGLIEESEGGTLFLDEAADIPHTVQAKMLRVLEGGVVRRVGASRETRVGFALVVSTQESAHALVSAGRWRADFYYRVASIGIRVPALSEHISDLPLLIDHFLELLGRPPLRLRNPSARLLDHDWPGNVREVRCMVEQAAFRAGEGPVTESILEECLAHRTGAKAGERRDRGRALREVERDHIEAVLRETGNDVVVAARVLGLSSRALYRRFHLLGIIPPRWRNGGELTRASGAN